jgi:hypothetical protein
LDWFLQLLELFLYATLVPCKCLFLSHHFSRCSGAWKIVFDEALLLFVSLLSWMTWSLSWYLRISVLRMLVYLRF